MPDTFATRIIYMEDDAGLARLLKKHLERRHFAVDVACNGEEGLALLRQNRYAIALVDYNMPVIGGMDVMLRLSELEHAPPVIMLTGEGNENVAVEAMKLGAADYLVKDVEMCYLELLPIMIEQVFHREQLMLEREMILTEARESEERYRRLVELSPDGISVHGREVFEFVNPAGAEILGAASCEELIGRSVLDFVHPDYHQVFLERVGLLEVSCQELPWLEEKFLRCDGSEVEVEVTVLCFACGGRQAFQTIFRDITERKDSERKLERMANYDALTALPNRSFFFDRLNQLLLQARREQTMFALIYIDLDCFKQVNDRLGHYMGDLLLKEVAQRLVSCVRDSDTVARMGGDEFVVILSKVNSKADAGLVAQKIGAAIATPYRIEDHECLLAASLGISLYPDDGETREVQLMKADRAMYRSKKSGHNKIEFSD